MNIYVKHLFSENDSFVGLPNVAVLVEGECNHADVESVVAETTFFNGDEDASYNSDLTVCKRCKAYQDMDGSWIAHE